jgi:hypothetical protein
MLSFNLPQILDGPTPGPRTRRTLKKEARPAQKDGLKSGRTMPKSTRPRNAAEGENRAFLSGKHRFWRDILRFDRQPARPGRSGQIERSDAQGEKS